MLFKCYFFDYINDNIFKRKNKIINMNIKEKTSIRKQGNISLITTIPKIYVKALNLESGDTINWKLDTNTEKIEITINKNKE